MTRRIDVHDYDRKLAQERALVGSCGVSVANQEAILAYWSAVFLTGMSKPRLVKEVSTIRLFAKRLGADLRLATKEQLQMVIADIYADSSYSVWTKADYANIVRKFFKWLEYGDGFRKTKNLPDRVAWISGHIKKKDKPKLLRSELLTEDEAHAMVRVTGSPRDKALLALFWDSGARLGEIGSMTIGSVKFGDDGTYVDLNGKTGPRTVFLIECTPHLLHWMSIHPEKETPEAPLWPISNNGVWNPKKPMQSRILAQVIDRAAARAGLNKNTYPHLFRHSRATWCANNDWTNLQMCKFFGWTLESDMPAYYTSLVNKDVHEKMRKSYGLQTAANDPAQQRKPLPCQRCTTPNPPNTSFCYRCGMALTNNSADLAHRQRNNAEHLLNALVSNPEALNDVLALATKHGLLRINPSTPCLTQVKEQVGVVAGTCSTHTPTGAPPQPAGEHAPGQS